MHSQKGCPSVESQQRANFQFSTVGTTSSASSGVATRASHSPPGPAIVSTQRPFGNQSGSVDSTASGGGVGEGSRQTASSQNIDIQSLPGSVATHQSPGFLPIPAYSVPNYSNAYTLSPMGHVLATHPSGSVATTSSGGVVGEGSRQGAGSPNMHIQSLPGPGSIAFPHSFGRSVATNQSGGYQREIAASSLPPIPPYSVPNYSNAYSPPPMGHVVATHPSGSVATMSVVGEGSRQGAGGYQTEIAGFDLFTTDKLGGFPTIPDYSVYAYAQSPPMGPLPVPQLQTLSSPYPSQYSPYPPQYSPYLPQYSPYPMWIPNNANPGVQGGFSQQQLSLPYKHDSKNVLSSAQKMLNAFPGQNIRPTLIVDPFGAMHMVDKHTNKCYWTAETGRSAFKFIKDKDQVLDKYFEFRGNGGGVVGLIDENELVHFTKNGQQHVEFSTSDSMKQKLRELYGAQFSGEFEVTADTEYFWLDCRSGDIIKCRLVDQDDFLKMSRSDFKIVNRVHNWEFYYSVFKLSTDGGVDENIDIIHCRNYEKYLTLMKNFHIRIEELMVYYDKRRRWNDGKVTYEGRLNTPVSESNTGFTNVTAELLQRAEDKMKSEYYRDKRKAERYLLKFSHPNILNFHGAYECEKDVFLVFESFSNDLEACGYGKFNEGYIMRAVLSAVVHLFKHNCLHGNLIAQNIVLTADNEVKLYGLLPDAPSSKAAQEKEIIALAKLLNWCASGDTQPLPKDYDRSKDPLAFYMLDKLNSGRVSMSQLKRQPIFWKPRKFLKFILDVTSALDFCNASEDGMKLRNAFLVDAFQESILNRRKSSIHRIFLENIEHASMYRTFRNRVVHAFLKFIRNAYIYDPQLEDAVRELYGESVDGLEKYVSDIFPYLRVEVYQQVEPVALEDSEPVALEDIDLRSYFF